MLLGISSSIWVRVETMLRCGEGASRTPRDRGELRSAITFQVEWSEPLGAPGREEGNEKGMLVSRLRHAHGAPHSPVGQ